MIDGDVIIYVNGNLHEDILRQEYLIDKFIKKEKLSINKEVSGNSNNGFYDLIKSSKKDDIIVISDFTILEIKMGDIQRCFYVALEKGIKISIASDVFGDRHEITMGTTWEMLWGIGAYFSEVYHAFNKETDAINKEIKLKKS